MSKFKSYLNEVSEFKRKEIAQELKGEGANRWAVYDDKKKKFIKRFESYEKRSAEAYANACNKKSESKNFSVIETA